MSQERILSESSVSNQGTYNAPDIGATLNKVSQTMKKVRVVHGSNSEYLDLEGKTVGFVRKKLRDVFNLPSDADALIANKTVGDDFVLEGSQTLEFVKEAGVKG